MFYDIKFSCGHTETIQLYGPTKDRERKIEMYEKYGTCPVCRKAEAKKQVEECSKQFEAPELTGSEKQIAWAEDIRANKIKDYIQFSAKNQNVADSKLNDMEMKKHAESVMRLDALMVNMLAFHTSAKFWIDNRGISSMMMLKTFYKNHPEKAEVEPAETAETPETEEPQVVAETTPVVRPESDEVRGTATVKIKDETIFVSGPYDNAFSSLVSSLHFRWDAASKAYKRICSSQTGSAMDRSAEVANTLLRNGFAVACDNDEIRDRAVSADFVPECRRWIGFNSDAQKITLRWDRDDDDFYSAAKRIPGSRWDRDLRAFTAPLTSYLEVLDFADINGFKLTQGGSEAIEQQRRSEVAAFVQSPDNGEILSADKLAEILKSSADVLDDLVDD